MAIAELNLQRGIQEIQRERLAFPEHGIEIPVYDIRDLLDQELIAREIAQGRQMAMFGGVWGGFQGIPEANGNSEGYLRWAKQDRPREAKYVVMKPPSQSHELIDWSNIHEEFRFLEDPESFDALWRTHGAYLHVIAPIKEEVALPDVFVTSPDEHTKAYPNRPRISASTSAFLWRSDPYFENFAQLVDASSETPVHIGVTSLNKHGEKPPYSYEDFVAHLKAGNADPRNVHLIVRDSLYETSGALGSHTQIRLPLKDEEGVVEVYRIGTLSPRALERKTGIALRQRDGIKDVRKNPGVSVDMHIELLNQKILNKWQSEPRLENQGE